jgi:hypothetical protein
LAHGAHADAHADAHQNPKSPTPIMESSKKRTHTMVACDEDDIAVLDKSRKDRAQKFAKSHMDRAKKNADDICELAENYDNYLDGDLDESDDEECGVGKWISCVEKHLKDLKTIVSENPDLFQKR